MECGSRDEYGLQWGARALVARMRALGLAPRHEEFEDGHRSTSYRFDVSVPLLARALA